MVNDAVDRDIKGRNPHFGQIPSSEALEQIRKKHDDTDISDQQKIKEQSWLEKGHPLGDIDPVDFQLLALLNGDGHINGSGYEGYSSAASLCFYSKFLENFIAEEKENPRISSRSLEQVQAFYDESKNALLWAEKIEGVHAAGAGASSEQKQKLISDLANEMVDYFKDNTVGWIPGGWFNASEGNHGLMLRIDKDQGVYIVNTGVGVNLHKAVVSSVRDPLTGELKEDVRYQEFARIAKPDKKRLMDPKLFEYLIEMQVHPRWDGSISVKPESMYEALETFLGRKIEKELKPSRYQEAYKKSQRSETCAIKSVSTSLYYSMCQTFSGKKWGGKDAVNDYKKVKFLWQTQTLVSFLKKTFAEGAHPEQKLTVESVRLTRDFVDNLRRSSEKLEKNGSISSKELEEFLHTAADIDQRLDAVKEIWEREARQDEPLEYDFKLKEGQLPGDINIERPVDDRELGVEAREAAFREDPTDQVLVAPIKNPLVKFKDPKKAMESIQELLSSYRWLEPGAVDIQNEVMKRLYDIGGTKSKLTLDRYIDAICEIPPPTHADDEYWAQLPQEQVLPCMRQLSLLHNNLSTLDGIYRDKFFSINPSHSAQFSLASYTLLATMDKLARRLPEAKLDGYKTNFQELLLELQSQYFTLDTTKQNEQLKGVLKYCFPDFTLKDLREKIDIKEFAENSCNTYLHSMYEVQTYFRDEYTVTPFKLTADKDTIKSNPTLLYFKQFIDWDNADFTQKMRAAKCSAQKPLMVQISKVMACDAIPEAAKLLKDMSLRSALITLQGNTKVTKGRLYPHVTTQVNITLHQSVRNAPKKITITASIPARGLVNKFFSARTTDATMLKPQGRGPHNQMLVYEEKKHPQNDIIFDREKFLDLDLETSRELAQLFVDPYDAVNRLVVFGRNHMNLMDKPQIQELFNIYLYRPFVLQSAIEDQPEIIEQIKEFIKEGIGHYRQLGDVKSALHFASQGYRLSQLIEGFASDLKIESNLPDYREEILRKILPLAKSPAETLDVYRSLMLLHVMKDRKDFVSDQNAKTLAAIDYLRYMIEAKKQNDGVDIKHTSETRYLECFTRMTIEENVEDRAKILNAVLRVFNHGAALSPWDGNYPTFSNDEYVIDLNTFVISKKDGAKIVEIPYLLKNDPTLKKLLQGKIEHVERVGIITYVLHPQLLKCQIDRARLVRRPLDPPKFYFSMPIDGKEYVYTPLPNALKDRFPSVFNGSEVCWVHGGDEPHMLFQRDGKTFSKGLLVKDAGGIINIDEIQVHLDGKYKIDEIQIKDKNDEWAHLVPKESVCPNLLAVLSEHENLNHIECYKKPGGDSLSTVHMSRLGLNFTIRENGVSRAYSQEHPGYYIAPNQKVPGLPRGVKSLVLQNQKGEKIVLVPRTILSVTANKNGEGMVYQELSHGAPIGNASKSKWIEFSLIKGQLHALKTRSRLHLAYICMVEGNYNGAANELKKVAHLKRFGAEDNAHFTTMYQLMQTNSHPDMSALMLKLFILLKRNHLKYPLPIGVKNGEAVDLNTMIQCYQAYITNMGNITRHRLSQGEEKFFLEQLRNRCQRELDEAKKSKNTDSTQQAQMIWNMVQYRTDNRWNYLTKGTAKPHILPFQSVVIEMEKPAIDLESVIGSFIGYQGNEETTAEVLFAKPLLDPAGETLSRYCWDYYRIAREGTDEQRAHILKILDLNKAVESNEVRGYQTILRALIRKPKRFPTIAQLAEVVQDRRDAKARLDAVPDDWNRRSPNYKLRLRREKEFKAAEKVRDKTFKRIQKHVSKPNMIITYIKNLFQARKMMIAASVKAIGRTCKGLLSRRTKDDKTKTVAFSAIHSGTYKKVDEAFDHFFEGLLGFMTVTQEDQKQEAVDFPVDHADPIVAAKLKREKEELQTHLDRMGKKTVYKLKKPNDLVTIKKELTEKAAVMEGELKAQQQTLLWQVNHVESDLVKKMHKGGFRQEVSWQDLQKLFLSGRLENFQAKTQLGDDDIQRVMCGIGGYLVRATRVQQMRNALAMIDKIEKGNGDEKSKELLAQYLGEILAMKREYNPSLNERSKLWFEYANGYLYRAIQLQKLKELRESGFDENLGEMPTGFGKTKTMMATLDDLEALDLDQLVINTWPASIEMTNTRDIQQQMLNSFGRKIDHITFNRTIAFSVDSLKQLYRDLKKDVRLKRPVNIRSEALRSMELHYIDVLQRLAKKNTGDVKGLGTQALLFYKILQMIRANSWASFDEADNLFHPMNKLIYTIGEPDFLPNDQVEVIEELFDVLTEEPIASLLDIRKNKQPLVVKNNSDMIKSDVLPKLAEHFCDWLSLEGAQREEFKQFVLGKEDEIPAWMNEHPKRELMALLKGELTNILLSCCKGYVNENFGLSKLHLRHAKHPKEFAISYASSNTPKENKLTPSQFKNPHETLNKTYITYLHQGLARFQVSKMIKTLKDQMEIEAEEGVPLESTKANKIFKKMLPESDLLLYTLKESDIDAIYEKLQHNKPAIFYYVRNVIVPQIKIYPETLISTVQNFRSQFTKSLSVTATPPDPATHGPNTHFIPMKGTSGQVTYLMLTKADDPSKIHVIDSIDPEKLLDDSIAVIAQNKNIRAMIDVGAQFKGLSNKQVADKLRAHFKDEKHIEGIVFFDEKHEQFKVLEVETGTVCDLEESEIEPEKRFTIYDQNRSFGSDIKQKGDAIATVQVGLNSTKAAMGQGAGRMRQLHKDQSIQPIVPKALAEKIFADLENPTMEELLLFIIENQAHEEARNNYHAQQQQMDNEIRRAVVDKLLGLPIGVDAAERKKSLGKKMKIGEIVKHFKAMGDVLMTPESCDPWDMYANVPKPRASTEILEEHYQACLERAKKMKGLTKKERQKLLAQLNVYPEHWGRIPLPKEMIQGKAGLGMECEVLQEVEVEVEVEVEQQVHEDFSKREAWKWEEKTDLFKSGWEKPSKMMGPFSRAVRKVHRVPFAIWEGYKKLNTKILGSSPLVVVGLWGCLHGFAVVGGSGAAGACAGALVASLIAQPIITGLGLLIGATALVTVWGVWKLSKKIWKWGERNITFKINDVMICHLPRKYRKKLNIFSDNFIVSNNFYTERLKAISEVEQRPFTQEQKSLNQIVVIQDNDGGLKVIAIDQNDSVFFRQKLKEDMATEDVSKRKRKVAIYDLHSGIVAQGKNGFAKGELEKNPEFVNLLVQAKIINGEVKFIDAELRVIAGMLEKTDKETLQSFCQNEALRHHVLHKKVFNQKPIAQLLTA